MPPFGENLPLLNPSVAKADDIAKESSGSVGYLIGGVQVLALLYLFFYSGYADVEEYSPQQYIIFRDIMVMLLLGFGYLMTFLEKYGLGAVGFTMLLTALNMECNFIAEGLLSSSHSMSFEKIINAEFSAAALLISFGALIGRATPLQMCIVAIVEAIFYAINKVILVFGIIQAEDVGGTITIHMFGAYFGLAVAYALGPQEKESASNNSVSRVSDVFSLVGTTLLWVYWPSFVGATETGVDENEMHCLVNTILALIGSTGATFYLSQALNEGKFDAVHVQNSTLAGGVAIGATARLALGPFVALLVGVLAGSISVLGYFYSSPFLESKFGIYDTCGVANLHGYPSVLGGLLSILLVFLDHNADFLVYGLGTQSIAQLLAVVVTLLMAMGSGYLTGSVLIHSPEIFSDVADYDDAVWWIDVE
jgi:ammonium transporter Rh